MFKKSKNMKVIFKNLVGVGLFLVLVATAGLVLAQGAAPAPEALVPVSCFDYYKFGSVKVEVVPSLSEIANGGELGLVLNVANENDYPVVEGSIYMKMYRKQTDAANAQKNGGFLIDYTLVKEKVNLDAKATKKFDFTWRVPTGAPSGEYEAVTYFLSDKRMNLLGLPFTDDVSGGRNSFKIVSDTEGTVQLDKNKVTLNNKAYRFVGNTSPFSKNEKVVVRFPITNTTKTSQSAEVSYDLYFWDGTLDSQRLKAKREVVTLTAGETKTLVYEIDNTSYPVYYLVAKSKWQDSSSILNVRFARSGVSRGRINFVGLSKFPLTSGEANTVFACIHNASLEPKTTGKFELELVDGEYNVIKKYTYAGNITGNMMGFKGDFTAPGNYGALTLRANVFDGGEKLVDQVGLSYDCREIDPQKCPAGAAAPVSSKPGFPKIDMIWIIIGGVVVIFIVILTVIMAKKKKMSPPPPGSPKSPVQRGPSVGVMRILIGLLILGSFLLPTSFAEARRSVTFSQNDTSISDLDFNDLQTGLLLSGVEFAIMSGLAINYDITYWANAYEEGSLRLIDQSDGRDAVQSGSVVNVSYNNNDFTRAAANINWLETGNIQGTPTGIWDTDGNGQIDYPYPVAQRCNPLDAMTTQVIKADGTILPITISAPFVVQKPRITFSSPDPLINCSAAGATSAKCTVTGGARVGYIDVKFDETPSKHFADAWGADERVDPAVRACYSSAGNTTINDFVVWPVNGASIVFEFDVVPQAPVGLAAPVLTGPAAAIKFDVKTYSALVGINPPATSLKYTFQRRYGLTGSWVNVGTSNATPPTAGTSNISFANTGTYYVRANAENLANGLVSPWSNEIAVAVSLAPQGGTQCSNGVDDPDPEDALADSADPGCHTDGNAANPGTYDPSDNDETDQGNGVCVPGNPPKPIGTCSASCGPGIQFWEKYVDVSGVCEIEYYAEPCNLRACGYRIREGNPGGP